MDNMIVEMKKTYLKPTIAIADLDMQNLLCNSPMNMDKLPSDPGKNSIEQSSNIWVSNNSSIWD